MRKDGRSDNSILLSKWLRLSKPTPYEEGTRTARAILQTGECRCPAQNRGSEQQRWRRGLIQGLRIAADGWHRWAKPEGDRDQSAPQWPPPAIFSVSDLNARARLLLKEGLGWVWIRRERLGDEHGSDAIGEGALFAG